MVDKHRVLKLLVHSTPRKRKEDREEVSPVSNRSEDGEKLSPVSKRNKCSKLQKGSGFVDVGDADVIQDAPSRRLPFKVPCELMNLSVDEKNRSLIKEELSNFRGKAIASSSSRNEKVPSFIVTLRKIYSVVN